MKLIYFTRPHTQDNILILQARLHRNLKLLGLKRCTTNVVPRCSSKRSFLKQVDKIKAFMPWNGYPSHVHNSVIKHLKTSQQRNERNKEEDDRKIIWLQFPYLGKKVKFY